MSPSPAPLVDADIHERLRLEQYREAFELLLPRYRDYIEDKSYEQTAASLGVPLGTVKALLHRARKRLIELAREAA